MNKGRASQTRPNFWIKKPISKTIPGNTQHRHEAPYWGGYERCKHIQPIDRRPTIIQTLTEKKSEFWNIYTRARARARGWNIPTSINQRNKVLFVALENVQSGTNTELWQKRKVLLIVHCKD